MRFLSSLLLLGGVVASQGKSYNSTSSKDVCDTSSRSDCGFDGITQAQCEAKGCGYVPVNPNPSSIPWCFHKTVQPPSYYISHIQTNNDGLTYTLKLVDNTAAGLYGDGIDNLSARATFDSENRFHFKVTDPANPNRWEIPESILPLPKTTPINPNNALYSISSSAEGDSSSLFWMAITRKSDSKVIFNATDIAFADQYLQLSNMYTSDSSINLYGLGERIMSFKLPLQHSFTMWSADIPTPPDQNIYGSHPFYMQHLSSGNSHGVFFKNSNGMDVFTTTDRVTYKAIGGVLDYYVFVGPTPEAVTQQYHSVIGLPYFPPIWSLGWHQCRYGYKNIQELESVVANYKAANIPLDIMWSDIDHMNKFEDFSFDPVNYPVDQVNAFANSLHQNGQHYVTIVDPGIHNRQGYPAYDDGLAQNVFTTVNDGKTPYIGTVWPGTVAYPDFLSPNSQSWWQKQLESFRSLVPVDGIWIDMNELSNFQDGQPSDPTNPVNNPPYAINNFNQHAGLGHNTVPVDALHYGGIREYNVHNLFGLLEGIATKEAMENLKKERAFVLSRSTFAGSGAHVAHWLGDNHATFESMASSISGILQFNLYGVPLVGADACGFMGPGSEELCARWSSLAAFTPFARNHKCITDAAQPAYLTPTIASSARTALNKRYELLPYIYTNFYNVNQNGGTVAKPLWFKFPTDANTYGIDQQFLFGEHILVTPVLTQGALTVTGYFPPASLWYDIWTGALLTTTGSVTLSAPVTYINVHVAGGVVIPTQPRASAVTVADTLKAEYVFIVALDAAQSAIGQLYVDDGVSLDSEHNSFNVYFNVANNTLSSNIGSNTYTGTVPALTGVNVWGVKGSVTGVIVNGASVSTFSTDANKNLLISGLNVDVTKPLNIQWKTGTETDSIIDDSMFIKTIQTQ